MRSGGVAAQSTFSAGPIRALSELIPTRVDTPNRQELIIGLNTALLPNYNTIRFASADETGLISFWDNNCNAIYQIGIGQTVRSLSWDAVFGYLLATTDHDIYAISVQELATGKNNWTIDHWHVNLIGRPDSPPIYAAPIGPEGNTVVIDQTGSATIYTPGNDSWLQWHHNYISGDKRISGSNRDRNIVFSINNMQESVTILVGTNELMMWDIRQYQEWQKIAIPLSSSNEAITALSWSPYTNDLAIGTDKGSIMLWHYDPKAGFDTNIPQSVHTLKGKTGAMIHDIAWYSSGPNQLHLLAATNHGVAIWDYNTRTLSTSIPNAGQPKENVKAIATVDLSTSGQGVYTNRSIGYALVTGEKFVDFWR
jgi:WD40 repeat protein